MNVFRSEHYDFHDTKNINISWYQNCDNAYNKVHIIFILYILLFKNIIKEYHLHIQNEYSNIQAVNNIISRVSFDDSKMNVRTLTNISYINNFVHMKQYQHFQITLCFQYWSFWSHLRIKKYVSPYTLLTNKENIKTILFGSYD